MKPEKITLSQLESFLFKAAELDTLNRIVTAYLEFAELQALSRKPMYMQDWIAKLDDFLKLSGRELLADTIPSIWRTSPIIDIGPV